MVFMTINSRSCCKVTLSQITGSLDDETALRILQVSSAEFSGGGERYLIDLANALAGRGHDVYAALRPGSPLASQLLIPEQHTISLPLRNSFDANSARRLANFTRQNEIDIVHAHMARDYPLAAYASARSHRARFIVTRHVLFPMNRLHKLTFSRVARVIAVSEAVALQLRSERIVSEKKIATVQNGVNVARFEAALAHFDRGSFLLRWGLPAEASLIGTVGELKALKGQEEFLKAAIEVAQAFPKAHFIIAGVDSSRDQRQRKALVNLTAGLGLTDRVRFIDWLDDIAELYCALDVFVSASRAESFGLAMAEAMATGTVVVATKTEGAKQLLEPEVTGLLVPVGDAMAIARAVVSLLTHQEQRMRIGAAARKAIREHFSLERMVAATEAIYEESLKSGSR